MANMIEDLERIQKKFAGCKDILIALGDETRQHILFMMICGPCGGSRVVDIAAKTNLSRPAVSHHMQILKAAGIVKDRKERTYIYYYLDPQNSEIEKMVDLFQDIGRIMLNAPDRSGRHEVF